MKINFLICWFVLAVVVLIPRKLLAETVGSGFCNNFRLDEIPVANLSSLSMPLTPMRVTQRYNNGADEGWCNSGTGYQAAAGSAACKGKKIYYGHDGLDLHPQGAQGGQTPVLAVVDGLVVASHRSGIYSNWGESMILASRANPYSEEILTFHFHHLYLNPVTKQTSRLYNSCSRVRQGEEIAREGGTPSWPTHLHLSVKRWKNLAELQNRIRQNPAVLYGNGYSFGNNSQLANYLDPEALLYDYFSEFQSGQSAFPDWQWAQPYALEMRHRGWAMGEFDSRFGVDLPVKRREAVRWIKQSLELPTVTSSAPNSFYDLPFSDPDFPYLNTLMSQKLQVPVISPESSCTSFGHYFCPDQELLRAQAIKMIVAGFFQEEFLETYDNWIWKAAAPLANNLLSQFHDVSALSWYAPYVYFAWQKGLTGTGKIFSPGLPVRRAELAKWLVMAYQIRHGSTSGFCGTVSCQGGYYCDQTTRQCRPVPTCIPWENSPCPLGGGYGKPGTSDAGPAGSNTDAANGVPVGSGSSDSGVDNGSGYPDGGTGSAGSSLYSCQKDPQFSAPCALGLGICFRAGVRVCNPAGDGLLCNAVEGAPNPAGEICSNQLDDNCNGATDESPCQTSQVGTNNTGDGGSNISNGGNNGYDGSSGGSTPGNQSTQDGGTCQVHFHLSPSGASCYGNPAGSGSPTLCLEIQPGSGTQYGWRLCKPSGSFQNYFTYELLDQNHLSHYLGGVLTGQSGTVCTGWKYADFSYLTQNNPVNGAGLMVEVHSPGGCTSPSCTYRTGITTLYRDCH